MYSVPADKGVPPDEAFCVACPYETLAAVEQSRLHFLLLGPGPHQYPTPQNQFCSLLASQEGYQRTMGLHLDYGHGVGLSKELAARMKEQADYVHSLNTIVDALNHLGVQG